jgi:Protein of unknown function (DUF2905)
MRSAKCEGSTPHDSVFPLSSWHFALRTVMAKVLVVVGLVIAALGLIMMAGFPLGRLPGDVTVRRGAFTFYFPLASSILVSVVLTLVLYLLRR